MNITDHAFGIDNHHQRHSSQLEEVDLLAILKRYLVIWIWQAEEWNPLRLPVRGEGFGPVGPNRQDLCTPTRELRMLVPQARQLRTAVRSHESSQERQQHRLAPEL